MMNKMLISLIMLILIATGCSSSNKKFSNGEYNDPTKVKLLDDKFNEADMQKISSDMVNKLSKCEKFLQNENTVVFFGKMYNHTAEHMDLDALADKMESKMVKLNVAIVNARERGDVETELQYQEAKNIASSTNIPATRYMISGFLTSNTQEVENEKLVYYKMNVKLTDLATTKIVCSEETELRKEFYK